MSTLRISNIEAKSVPASATIDEKVKITNSSGDVLVFLDGKTSGITTVGINTTDGNITFDANSNVVVTGIITATKFVGTIEPTSLEIGSNIKLGNAGVITATSFVGSGANLTNLPAQVNITNNADNRVITGGSGVNLNGESNLTYNGSNLTVTNSGGASELTLTTPNNTDGGVYFRTGSTNAGAVSYLHSDNTMKFRVNSLNRLQIDSGGRAFLGVNPQGRLCRMHISGDNFPNAAAGGSQVPLIVSNQDADYGLQIGAFSSGKGFLQATRNDGTATVYNIQLNPSGGNVEIPDGNLVVASGHGIDFSATGDGSGTDSSELLDDYEEGSWTPVIKGSITAGTATYTTRGARYVKVGRLVHIYADVRWSAHNGSGGLEVHGLPYAQVGGYWGHFGVNYNSGMSYATDVHYGWANVNGDYIRYWETNSSGGSGSLALDSVVGEVHFYGHYLTTA